MMTLAVLGRFRDLGLSVPDDVSPSSASTIPPAAAQMHPALTVVAQPIAAPRLPRDPDAFVSVVSGGEVPRTWTACPTDLDRPRVDRAAM